jgi:hypothetical protein
MKALILFTGMVLGYSMINMVHLKVGASTYKDGINAYMSHQSKVNYRTHYDEVKVNKRSPAVLAKNTK